MNTNRHKSWQLAIGNWQFTKQRQTAHCKMLIVLLAAFTVSSCQKEVRSSTGGEPPATHNLTIKFSAVADAQPLQFGNTYTNAWGEPYSVSVFKFYIAQLKLINTDSGTAYNMNKDEYFLVNFGDSASITLNLKAVPSTYNRIGFLLGVDSIRNVSGAQTGALDPTKGMFWTWNSGYIMAKLEGYSPLALTHPNNQFEYHIGGFAGSDNVLKQLTLPFPLGQAVTLQEGKSSEIIITANTNAWFAGPNAIHLSTNSVCTTPGPLAKKIADNYAGMFNVSSIVNQ
jgi:hypothetical protein